MRIAARTLVALALAGLAAGLAALWLIAASDHAEHRALSAGLGLLVGWSFIGAGLYAWWREPANRTGRLMAATGATWFIGALAAANAALPFTIGVALCSAYAALAAHLLLAYPSGRLQGHAAHAAVAAAYAICVAGAPLALLFGAPAGADGGDLPRNLLLIADRPAFADALTAALNVAAIVVALAVAALLVRRVRAISARQRGEVAPVLWAGIATVALIALQISSQSVDDGSGLADVFNMVGLVAFLIVPYGFLGGLLRTRVARVAEAAAQAEGLSLENERLHAELRARIEELRASRARIVEAGYPARRKIERDLHDGAQQRLVALSLSLSVARQRLHAEPDVAARLLDGVQEELGQTLAELRELARGWQPAVLADHGLPTALDALAARLPVPVAIEATTAALPEHVEAAAYFVVAESLTNVAKYARASTAAVSVARRNGHLRVEVRDDGVGGADPAGGSGLRGLAERVAVLDGRLEVDSPAGRGTTIRAEIPCASS